MANENLKIALQRAGLTAEQFAEIISVDPKTVQRWVGGRTPYARHRATVARALDLAEHALWPDDVPPPAANPDLHAVDRESGSEVIGTWAYDTDPGAPDPVKFVTERETGSTCSTATASCSRHPALPLRCWNAPRADVRSEG